MSNINNENAIACPQKTLIINYRALKIGGIETYLASGTVKSNLSDMSLSPFSNLYICFSVSPPALASKTSEYSIIGVSSGKKPKLS